MASASPIISGYLYRLKGNALFKTWSQRYVELWDDTLVFSVLHGGVRTGEFQLTPNILFAESSLRHFCFSLTNSVTQEVQYFAAENMAFKEAWSEKLQLVLMQVKLLHQRQNFKDHNLLPNDAALIHDEVTNQYQSRPLLYIKIIQARNLIEADFIGKSDPYVIINIGPSSVRTITRKRTINPEWGMVFNFDLDRSYRYAKIEVWDDDFGSSGDDFLGAAFIPLLHLRSGYNDVSWYPLGKRSSKSLVTGEIQIEISCSGDPDPDHHSWHFFRELRQLPELTLRLKKPVRDTVSSLQSLSMVHALKEQSSVPLGGFPLYFPPIETEVLEDISVRVHLNCSAYGSKVICKGVLLLTNFRIIFVSFVKLLSLCRLPSTQLALANIIGTNPVDLTTQIPIGNIFNVAVTSETDANNNTSINILKVTTVESRVLSFVFREDIELFSSTLGDENEEPARTSDLSDSGKNWLENSKHYLQQMDLSILDEPKSDSDSLSDIADDRSTFRDTLVFQSNLTNSFVAGDLTISKKNLKAISSRRNSGGANNNNPFNFQPLGNFIQSDTGPSDIEKAWVHLTKMSSFLVDSADSPDGPPCHRMFLRLHYCIKNRPLMRLTFSTTQGDLIDAVESQYTSINANASKSPRTSKNEIVGGGMSAPPNVSSFANAAPEPISFADPADAPAHLPLGWSIEQDINQVPKSEMEAIEYNCGLQAFKQNVKALSLPACIHIKKLIEDPWAIYDPLKEFERMSIPDWLWRISTCNETYEVSPTYPALVAVPMSVDDEAIKGSASFRSKGRFPALSWRNSNNNCTISRCSQPLVGISQNRSVHDEKLVSEINHSGGQHAASRYQTGSDKLEEIGKPIIIVDARPLLNATANQAAGKGFESEKYYENASVIFMDIANIHAVRKSLEQVEEACYDEINWLKNLEGTGWMSHIRKILIACTRIVHFVWYEDLSVLVHCSDGWDRTSQLTSISMLMLDPYYRTLRGFIVLIEKEWISFGHKFADRLGWTKHGWKDEERSPVFVQFLDCVFQCLVQSPNAYEFNEELLLFLAEHTHSGWFGNFMFNCEKEVKENNMRAVSIWTVVLSFAERFTNENYRSVDAPVVPIPTKARLTFWNKWFLNWHDKVWHSSWVQESQAKDVDDPDSAASFEWADDKTAKGCKRCAKEFTFIRRRHHCRSCGQIFCEACANEHRIVPRISTWRLSRCCVDCAVKIDQQGLQKLKADDEIQEEEPSEAPVSYTSFNPNMKIFGAAEKEGSKFENENESIDYSQNVGTHASNTITRSVSSSSLQPPATSSMASLMPSSQLRVHPNPPIINARAMSSSPQTVISSVNSRPTPYKQASSSPPRAEKIDHSGSERSCSPPPSPMLSMLDTLLPPMSPSVSSSNTMPIQMQSLTTVLDDLLRRPSSEKHEGIDRAFSKYEK